MVYSFVVPIYKDAQLARAFCKEFADVMKRLSPQGVDDQDFELVFVNDGRFDDQFTLLQAVCCDYPFAKAIQLSRNFGQHIALTCGYEHCRGEYVGMLNVDMEDPPNQIPVLLKAMDEQSADLAISLRNKTMVRSFGESISSILFNFILNTLTGNHVPLRVGTLRIMRRRFLNAYNQLNETTRYIPGLEAWLGFKHIFVETVHQSRSQGKSSYSTRRRLAMAVEAIVSFSDLPLRWSVALGGGLFLVGLALVIVASVQRLLGYDFLPGFVGIIFGMVVLSGIQIAVTGMSAIYTGRILKEVQRRPLYIVRDRCNF